MAVGLDILALVGFVCEAFLYGAYCLLFIASVYLILSMTKSRSFSKVIIILHCLLYIACTLHFALEFRRFLIYMTARDVPGFGSINHRTDISSFVVSVADFIGGLILMYRCWIIWDRNYLVAVAPILTSIAALPTAICLVWNLTGNLTWENDTPKASAAIMPLGRAAYILPLCTNVLTTGLILVRLWWVSRAVGTASMTRKAMHVVVESGLLYFLVQLVFVVVFCARSDSAMLMIAIVVQVYGIASTLIIIHIGLGLSSEQGKGAAVASRMSFSSTAGMRRQGPVIGAAGGTVEYNVQRPFDVYETYGRKMGMAVRQENIQRTVSNEEHPFDMIVEIGRE